MDNKMDEITIKSRLFNIFVDRKDWKKTHWDNKQIQKTKNNWNNTRLSGEKKTGIIKQTNENITREWGGGETNKNRCRFLSDRKRSVLCGCVLITFV